MLELVERKYECIDGREVMLAAASLPHLAIQRNLSNILYRYLKGKRCKVYSEAKVVFDDKNWFQPDILVVCDRDKVKFNHIEGAPDFVAEILSPTTQARDFGIKKDAYERFGVREYWIIDPMARTIIVHILRNGKYEVDDVYHDFTEEEWDGLTDEEKAQQKLTLKLSLYDDLEIDIKELFEDE